MVACNDRDKYHDFWNNNAFEIQDTLYEISDNVDLNKTRWEKRSKRFNLNLFSIDPQRTCR